MGYGGLLIVECLPVFIGLEKACYSASLRKLVTESETFEKPSSVHQILRVGESTLYSTFIVVVDDLFLDSDPIFAHSSSWDLLDPTSLHYAQPQLNSHCKFHFLHIVIPLHSLFCLLCNFSNIIFAFSSLEPLIKCRYNKHAVLKRRQFSTRSLSLPRYMSHSARLPEYFLLICTTNVLPTVYTLHKRCRFVPIFPLLLRRCHVQYSNTDTIPRWS